MTADLLLCWYAMGWVACGSVFAHDKSLSRADIFVCLIAPPLGLPAIVAAWVKRMQPLDTSKQYLWRRPE